MYCIHCGTRISDISKFCPKCGSKVESIDSINEPPKVDPKYKKETIGNLSKNNDENIKRKVDDYIYHMDQKNNKASDEKKFNNNSQVFYCNRCGKRMDGNGVICSDCRAKQNKNEYSTGKNISVDKSRYSPLNIIVPIMIIFIVTTIAYSRSHMLALILFIVFMVIWIEWAIGKFIGKRLSQETGIVLGVILILLGIPLFIGIPVIIYSNGAKKVKLE